MEKQNNKPNLNEITDLDAGIDIVDSNASCGRCIKRLDGEYKVYKKDIYRCKECSVLVDYWLKSEFKKELLIYKYCFILLISRS
jgi:hypothetical protein